MRLRAAPHRATHTHGHVPGPMAGEPLVRVRGVTKTYRRGAEPVPVLRGLDLEIAAGDFVAFMGPSGSGKTTLLNLLGGLDVPTAGTISVAGADLGTMSRRARAAWRARHVGFVFQLYNLLPVLTAYRNVELPLLLTRPVRTVRRRHVETALRIVGLGRPHAPLPAPALRRAGTAGRHRPRHRGEPDAAALRRADRRPRSGERRRRARPAGPARGRARDDGARWSPTIRARPSGHDDLSPRQGRARDARRPARSPPEATVRFLPLLLRTSAAARSGRC
jgi:ABC-type glutathione transport system ATPase component